MTLGNRPEDMDRQYGTPERLETRSSFWSPSPVGESPLDVATDSLRTAGARRVLEIGCGTGGFAESLQAELGAQVLATDQSEAMVAAAAQRGLEVQVVAATDLPYEDAQFDAVVAMWMLYHVTDLDRTLAEIRRVLKSGGVLVAVTNGVEHLADLLVAAGLERVRTQFMTENGEEILRRHFDEVEMTPTRGIATADHETARSYLATLNPKAADHLAEYEGIRTYHGYNAVFVAR